MMANRLNALVLALTLALASCANDPAPSASGAMVVPIYHLAPDDRVKVIVFGEPDISGEFLIGSDGNLPLPLVGAIPVNGLTLGQLRQRITERLGAKYLKDPKVSVDMANYRPFYVLGEVNKSGQYPYRVGLTVNAAVATAGGFTYRANHKTVAIQRFGAAGETRYKLTSDLQVGPGDTVRVLERFF